MAKVKVKAKVTAASAATKPTAAKGGAAPFAQAIAKNKSAFKKAQEAAKADGGSSEIVWQEGKNIRAQLLSMQDISSDDRVSVKHVWKCIDPESDDTGKVQVAWTNCGTVQGYTALLKMLSRLNVNTDDLDEGDFKESKLFKELPVSDDLQHPILVTCKHWETADSSGVNMYVNKVLTDEALPDVETVVDLAVMDRSALKKFIADNKLDVKVTKGTSDDAIRAAIKPLIEVEEEEEEGEEEEEEEDDDGVDLDKLDRAALKKFIKDNSLAITVSKGKSDDNIRKAIAELMNAEPEAEEEEEEEEEEEDDEATAELSVGDKINANHKGKEIAGIVKAISDAGEITVVPNAGQSVKKAFTVQADAIEKIVT